MSKQEEEKNMALKHSFFSSAGTTSRWPRFFFFLGLEEVEPVTSVGCISSAELYSCSGWCRSLTTHSAGVAAADGGVSTGPAGSAAVLAAPRSVSVPLDSLFVAGFTPRLLPFLRFFFLCSGSGGLWLSSSAVSSGFSSCSKRFFYST